MAAITKHTKIRRGLKEQLPKQEERRGENGTTTWRPNKEKRTSSGLQELEQNRRKTLCIQQ